MIKIPFHISKYGLITAQLFLINSFVCYIYFYKILSYFLFVLYITTILHWKNLKKRSIIKYLDILVSLLTIIRITFFDSNNFILYHKTIWCIYMIFIFFIFIINEYLFYIFSNNIFDTNNKYPIIYFINVFIHLFFLHVITNILCIYFIIKK